MMLLSVRSCGSGSKYKKKSKTYRVQDEDSILNRTQARGSSFSKPQYYGSLFHRLGGSTTLLMMTIGVMIGFLMGYDQASHQLIIKNQSSLKISGEGEDDMMMISAITQQRFSPQTTPLELLGLVRKTRAHIRYKLKLEYGEFMNVLADNDNLAKIFKLSDGAQFRIYRRIIQKLLKKQANPNLPVMFNWVTAGDVRATGLGSESSYTDVLEETVREAFLAVGVEFVATNKAIYGHASAPTMALCMEDVFGKNVDILSWDFSATDGAFDYRAAFWGLRASIHAARPILFMIDNGESGRWEQMFRIGGKIGVSLLDTAKLQGLIAQYLPDSSQIGPADIAKLPEPVQYLICNGAIEGTIQDCDNGSKHRVCVAPQGNQCFENKFVATNDCKVQQYQSDWNPGWRDHRLKGKVMGLLLLQMLQDALIELHEASKPFEALSASDRQKELVKVYEGLDSQDEFVLSNTAVPSNILGRFTEPMQDLTIPLFQRPAKCMLPDYQGGDKKHGLRRNLRVDTHRRLQEVPPEESPPAEGQPEVQPAGEQQQNIAAPEQVETPQQKGQTAGDQVQVDQSVAQAPSEQAQMDVAAQEQQEAAAGAPEQVDTPQPEGQSVANQQQAAAPNEQSETPQSEGQPEAVQVPIDQSPDRVQAEQQTATAPEQVKTPQQEGQTAGEQVQIDQSVAQAPSDQVQIDVATQEQQEGAPEQVEAVPGQPIGDQGQVEASLEPPQNNAGEAVPDQQKAEANEQQVKMDEAPRQPETDVHELHLPEHVEPIITNKEEALQPQIERSQEIKVEEAPQQPESVVHELQLPESVTPIVTNGGQETTQSGSCPQIPFQYRKSIAEIGTDSYDLEIDSNGDAFILVCFDTCVNGNCRRGQDGPMVANGKIVIEVDGVPVVGTREIDSCYFLEGQKNGLFWRSKRDDFRIRFKMTTLGETLKVYSIIVL